MSTVIPSDAGNRWEAVLANLSLADKEDLLNHILIDLSENTKEVKPTDWPYDLLMERKREVLEGRVQMQDWEVAKREILEQAKQR